MAGNVGFQDTDYDPDIHGEIDFNFFDHDDTPTYKPNGGKNNLSSKSTFSYDFESKIENYKTPGTADLNQEMKKLNEILTVLEINRNMQGDLKNKDDTGCNETNRSDGTPRSDQVAYYSNLLRSYHEDVKLENAELKEDDVISCKEDSFELESYDGSSFLSVSTNNSHGSTTDLQEQVKLDEETPDFDLIFHSKPDTDEIELESEAMTKLMIDYSKHSATDGDQIELESGTKTKLREIDDHTDSVTSEIRRKYSLTQRNNASTSSLDSHVSKTSTQSSNQSKFSAKTGFSYQSKLPPKKKTARQSYTFPNEVVLKINRENMILENRINTLKRRPVVQDKPFMFDKTRGHGTQPTLFLRMKKAWEDRLLDLNLKNAKPSKEISAVFSSFSKSLAVNKKSKKPPL